MQARGPDGVHRGGPECIGRSREIPQRHDGRFEFAPTPRAAATTDPEQHHSRHPRSHCSRKAAPSFGRYHPAVFGLSRGPAALLRGPGRDCVRHGSTRDSQPLPAGFGRSVGVGFGPHEFRRSVGLTVGSRGADRRDVLAGGSPGTLTVRPASPRDDGQRHPRAALRAEGVGRRRGRLASSACASGAACTMQGLRSATIPGKWACGGSALVSSFRKSGQPLYAWNSRLPVDSKIKARVSARQGPLAVVDTGELKILGVVKTTLVLDSATGRLLFGLPHRQDRHDPYTFSYTTIFAPIAVP